MKKLLIFLLLLFVLQSCKKSKDSLPSQSYLKLNVDGASYEYRGDEIGATYDEGLVGGDAITTLYTGPAPLNKPSLFINASAPAKTKEGIYTIINANYVPDRSGCPCYQQISSSATEKRRLQITKMSSNQLRWSGNFTVELSLNGTTKTVLGEFSIAIQ